MQRRLPGLVAVPVLIAGMVGSGQDFSAVSTALRDKQYDLATDGRAFLLREAAQATFFMLGELHGDRETPALILSLWPEM